MKKKRTKPNPINLDLLYPVASADPSETGIDDCHNEDHNAEYDDLYKWLEAMESKYSAEELAEMGFVEIPKTTKIIPDGEQAFFSAIKNGEDW